MHAMLRATPRWATVSSLRIPQCPSDNSRAVIVERDGAAENGPAIAAPIGAGLDDPR